MFRLFAARKLRSISTRRVAHLIVHLIVLLSLLLGYAPAPLLAAPPDPEEPAIEEPAGLDQTGVDPQAGAAEYVEDPAREEEPAVPLTYEEIEAAGKEQELPTELSLPPEAEGVDSELFLEQTTNDATDVAEEAAIIEIGENLPDSTFAPTWDEPLGEMPELAPDAFLEENTEEYTIVQAIDLVPELGPYRVLLPYAAANAASPEPSLFLISDEQFVSGLPRSTADIQSFLNQYGSSISDVELFPAGDFQASSAETLAYLGEQYSVSPSVLLVLLEQKSKALTSSETVVTNPYEAEILSEQLRETAAILARGFYAYYNGESALSVAFTDGETISLEAGNAATYALRRYYAEQAANHTEWTTTAAINEADFLNLFTRYFGDPLQGNLQAQHPSTVELAKIKGALSVPYYLKLPWANGDTWRYTGGPHNFAGTGDYPLSGIDFQPVGHSACVPDVITDRWIAASADGITVDYQENWLKLDHDNDGNVNTGWLTVYGHIANRIGNNLQVGQGSLLGNPSCRGGMATGVHLHFGIKYQNVWQPIDGTSLSGWVVGNGSTHYHGYLRKDGQTKESCYRADGSSDCSTSSLTSDNGGSPPSSNCQNYSYNGVVLFENKECNGEKREYGNAMTGVENLPGVGWNDRTSSVHVASGWSVRVWEHESSGGTRCLTNSMWDLSKDYYEGSGTVIDETITSVKVFNNGSCSDSTPSGRARLYSEPNWKGSVVWEGGTGFSNDPSANSYSMDLPDGWSAITYRGDNGGEPKRCWSADVANFQDHEDWQSKTQSIEVFDHDACPKPPADPSNLNISGATETSLTLTWQDNSGDENNFNIYKWDGVDFPYLVSVGANTTSYTDSGLNCGSPYFYKVSAYNGAGESNRVGFITGYTSDCSTPSTPSLASPDNGAVYDEGQSVVLSWNSANATEYYGEITGGPSALSFGWQGDTYADLGPQWAGYHYTWRVKARRGDQQSDWSESRTFTVRPGAPTNLSASSPSCGKVDLTWGDGSGNEDGYRIYRNGNAVAVVGADVTGFTQSSLPAGTHTYKVHAYRGAILSLASNETQVTVNQCVPAAKLGTTVTPATQVHNGVTRIATRFTLRESAGAPVNIQNYSYRWYSADGKEAFGAATTPAAISLNLPAGGSANWSIGLQLPRWVAQMAADRGDTAVRLYMTFRGVDSVGRGVKTGVYVTLGMAACSDATEPNNARGKARTITYGQTLNSVMCPAGELDLFTFSGTAGERIRIAARPRSGVDALNPKLELLRRDGAVLATNDNRAAGLWDARIGIVLPATDKYYIRVTDTKRRGGPQQGYQILLHQDSVQPVAAIRALAGGTWLHAKQQVIRVDASDRQTEIDHITFYARLPGSSALKLIGADYTAGDGWRMTWDTSKLPAGAGYGIIIRAVDGAGNYRDVGKYNLKLERTPPTVKAAVSASYGDAPFRAFVVKWNNGADSGAGITSYDVQVRKGTSGAWTNWVTNTTLAQARYLGADDQTYYFRARARDKAGNVSAYASGAGDTRYTVNVCPVAKDGYETDDSAAAAKAVRSDGSRYSHNFHAEGNVDWMKFTAAAGATYVLRTYMVGKHADTVLTLYKSDGKTVLASNDDLSDATYASRITWQAPAYGTYYLQVKHYDKYGFGCTTGYNVAVTKQAAASSGLENGAGDPAGNPTDNVVDGEPALPGDLPPLEDEGDQPPAGDAVEQFFQLFLPLTQR